MASMSNEVRPGGVSATVGLNDSGMRSSLSSTHQCLETSQKSTGRAYSTELLAMRFLHGLAPSAVSSFCSSVLNCELANGLSATYDANERYITLSNDDCIYRVDFSRVSTFEDLAATSKDLASPDGNCVVYCEDSKKLFLFGEELFISFSASDVDVCADYKGVDYVDFFHKPEVFSEGVSW